jgi:hypothetical protein
VLIKLTLILPVMGVATLPREMLPDFQVDPPLYPLSVVVWVSIPPMLMLAAFSTPMLPEE